GRPGRRPARPRAQLRPRPRRPRPRLRADALPRRSPMTAPPAPPRRRSLRRPRPAPPPERGPGGRAHRGRAYGGRAYGHRAPWALSGLAAALVGVALLSLGVGSVAITPGEVAAVVRAQLGLGPAEGYTMQQAVVLLYVRLPRVLLGLLVGAALGVSGAVMQGLFRNPLAEPGLVGVSAGSALTAVGFIVLGGGLALP